MSSHDPRPSFHEIREKHHLSLNELISDIDCAIPSAEIIYFDETGMGRPEVVDSCLASLSRLVEVEYNRTNVGQITFPLSSKVEENRSSGGAIWTTHNVTVNGEIVYKGIDWGTAARIFRDYANGIEPLVIHEVQHQVVPQDPVTGKLNWDVIYGQREGGDLGSA